MHSQYPMNTNENGSLYKVLKNGFTKFWLAFWNTIYTFIGWGSSFDYPIFAQDKLWVIVPLWDVSSSDIFNTLDQSFLKFYSIIGIPPKW